jgi:tripartite-type tricarboxylate transporter receptor subunit TctC
MADPLSRQMGQPVVVDNRPGAAGTIAMDITSRSAPDGYTSILTQSTSAVIAPAIQEKLPYRTLVDFSPVSLIAEVPHVLVVNPTVPANNLKELVALARTRSLNYASSGIGAGSHFSGEMLDRAAGIRTVHLPYKGAGPASADVAAGQIEFQFGAQITTQGLVKAGRLRMVAVTSAKRASTLPEVPTMAESGLPGFEFNNWFGVLGPAGLPAPLVARLNTELVKMMALPDVRERITFDGGEPAAGPPSEFRALLASDLSKWGKIAKCSQDTATRDIKDLIRRGALRQEPGGGRSTSYSLVLDGDDLSDN